MPASSSQIGVTYLSPPRCERHELNRTSRQLRRLCPATCCKPPSYWSFQHRFRRNTGRLRGSLWTTTVQPPSRLLRLFSKGRYVRENGVVVLDDGRLFSLCHPLLHLRFACFPSRRASRCVRVWFNPRYFQSSVSPARPLYSRGQLAIIVGAGDQDRHTATDRRTGLTSRVATLLKEPA
jgi:hypothetical protein